jgi:hypothetical protein
MKKSKFYIEYWTNGDVSKNVVADTFHIELKSLRSFIRKFVASGKYLVHLEHLGVQRTVLHSTMYYNHRDEGEIANA